MSDSVHLKAILTVVLLLFLSGANARAQPAFRVVDLNTTRSEGIQPGEDFLTPNLNFASLGQAVFFPASDGRRGFEPWQTDGTDAGTRQVADICPGVCGSTPKEFTTAGGLVFFVANDGLQGSQLWKSDGTPAGAARVSSTRYDWIDSLTAHNGLLLFSTPAGLWRSDGTAAGTFLLKPISFRPLARLGTKLFFNSWDQDHGTEVWTTDGTTAGTTLLKDINPGPSDGAPRPDSFNQVVAAAGSKVFFEATSPEGLELWASDGTESGTYLVKDIAPGSINSIPQWLTALGGQLYFFATDTPFGNDIKLWKSDGTAAGTQPVTTTAFVNATFLKAVGGRLLFFRGCDLWASDGTAAGTALVKSSVACQPFPQVVGGGKLLFGGGDPVHGLEPWLSDGTPAGTSLLADISPGSSSSIIDWTKRGTFNAGRWYFLARNAEDIGTQLWTSDGTAAGTRMLRINRQQSGLHVNRQGELLGPRPFFDLNGTLLFQGNDGVTGAQLWRTDGTAPGTSLLDLHPQFFSTEPTEFTQVGNTVFFKSDSQGTNVEKLWKTDGTPGRTELLLEFGHLPDGGIAFTPRDLTPFGNELLFVGTLSDFTEALVKSDGTPDGTTLVEGVLWGVRSIVSLGSKVLLQISTDLWEIDSTSAPAVRLRASLLPSSRLLSGSSSLRNGVLYFSGITPETGEELWQSDGTVAGTHLVAETVPGTGSKPLGPFVTVGPALYFVAGGNELWKNEAGSTSLVRTFPGNPASGILSLTSFRGKVYFAQDDGVNGRELWVSDGTAAGTHLFKDILPGPGSSNPGHLHVEDNILLFSATDGINNLEPWRSDGTVLGTRMLQDIAPGDLPSSPTDFTTSGSNLYFAANDGTTGFELWALPRQALLATFADVPTTHAAWRFIEALAASGITGGCGQGNFCPDNLVSRAEAAIFLVRAAHGSSFVPPPPTGRVFGDIPSNYWAAPWVEQLAADGVTAGCGSGNFCPSALLNRAEMAILLLRARHGSGFVPPPATGRVFSDIPATYWAAPWIERLAAEGLASGCGGGNYCPERVINRAETAVFLATVFALPLP